MKLISNIIDKFRNAIRGIAFGIKSDNSIMTQIVIGIIVISVSLFLKLSKYDFIIVVMLCGLVITIEVLNSAIELLSDYVTDKKFSNRIKIIKDLSAGAVLVISFCSFVVGIIIFFPYVF